MTAFDEDEQEELFSRAAMLELLLDDTDDIIDGRRGDQVRGDFELVEVVDIIIVPVVRCRWHGRDHIRFIDPYALAKKKEIRVHNYLIAIQGFIGDRWEAVREGVKRGSGLVDKLGDILFELLKKKIGK